MIEETHGDLRLLRFERLKHESGLVHAVTTRPQNMAPHHGSGSEQALLWRAKLCLILGVPFDRLTSPAQVHGGDCLKLEADDIGRGREGRQTAVPHVDGLLTDHPGVPLIVLSADCPIVCVYDPARRAVGAIHASWRGTVASAAAQLVRMMIREFGSDPRHLLAGICPSAGPCCYEVGHDVRRLARTRLNDADSYFTQRQGRLYLDLWAANRRQLTDEGLLPGNIELAGLCTICDQRFWSHRRDGQDAGRFALIVAVK